MSSGLIPQLWLDISGLRELEFILALAGAAVFVFCCCAACCPCFNHELAKIDPDKARPTDQPGPDCYYREEAPAADEEAAGGEEAHPASAPTPPPADTVIDVQRDCVLSINGRPVDAQRRGIALPYTPNRSLIVTSSAPVGAVQAPGPGEADYVPEVGCSRSAASSNAGGGAHKADGGGDDTWEADRMSSLEHRVRSLEAQLAVARTGGHGRHSATVAAANTGGPQAGAARIQLAPATVFQVQ